MSLEESGPGRVITIKFGKGYEAPWAVYRGNADELRRFLIEDFGIEGGEDMTLGQLTVQASSVANGLSAVKGELGGNVIPMNRAAKASPQEAAAPKPEPESEEDNNAPLIALLEGASDVATLKRLWAENRSAFTDPKVAAAYKARGAQLKKEN